MSAFFWWNRYRFICWLFPAEFNNSANLKVDFGFPDVDDNDDDDDDDNDDDDDYDEISL